MTTIWKSCSFGRHGEKGLLASWMNHTQNNGEKENFVLWRGFEMAFRDFSIDACSSIEIFGGPLVTVNGRVRKKHSSRNFMKKGKHGMAKSSSIVDCTIWYPKHLLKASSNFVTGLFSKLTIVWNDTTLKRICALLLLMNVTLVARDTWWCLAARKH